MPGSEIIETVILETITLEPFTRASTFAVNPIVDLPGTTSIGATGELKAAGRAVVVKLGAMLML